MEWTPNREKLVPRTGNFKFYGFSNDSVWKDERKKKLSEFNNICRYCGGKFKKYLFCFYLSGDPNNKHKYEDLEICCRACYLVTNLNFGLTKELLLVWSEMDQTTILRNTLEYIINSDQVPNPIDIDPKCKRVPLSLYEFINIIIKNNNILPNELSNFKIFFAKKFDVTFMRTNFHTKMPMFINDYQPTIEIYDNNLTEEEEIESHVLTSQELDTIELFLS